MVATVAEEDIDGDTTAEDAEDQGDTVDGDAAATGTVATAAAALTRPWHTVDAEVTADEEDHTATVAEEAAMDTGDAVAIIIGDQVSHLFIGVLTEDATERIEQEGGEDDNGIW